MGPRRSVAWAPVLGRVPGFAKLFVRRREHCSRGVALVKVIAVVAALAASVGLGAAANAKTITYVGIEDGSEFSIRLSDKPKNGIRVKLGVRGNATDLLGFGFDWKGDDLSDSNFRFRSSATGEGINRHLR